MHTSDSVTAMPDLYDLFSISEPLALSQLWTNNAQKASKRKGSEEVFRREKETENKRKMPVITTGENHSTERHATVSG